MKNLTTLLLTLLVLGFLLTMLVIGIYTLEPKYPKVPPIPEGFVSACDTAYKNVKKECSLYNTGLICSFKSHSKKNMPKIIRKKWLLLNTDESRIYIYTDDGKENFYNRKIRVDELNKPSEFHVRRFLDEEKFYVWGDQHIFSESGEYPSLNRETLIYEDRYGEMKCQLASAEQVKSEIDNQEEILVKEAEQKEKEAERQLEEKRLRDAEQLKKNKV